MAEFKSVSGPAEVTIQVSEDGRVSVDIQFILNADLVKHSADILDCACGLVSVNLTTTGSNEAHEQLLAVP